MIEVATSVFRPGTPVCVVPSRATPRLVASGSSASERWHNTSLFPGYSVAGRAYRLAMRAIAASGVFQRPVEARPGAARGAEVAIANLLPDELRGSQVTSALIGTDGPTRMLTLELRSSDGRVACYGKYAETPAAVRRLGGEARALGMLPDGLAPRLLRFEAWSRGFVLLTTPLLGRRVSPKLPPDPSIETFLHGLPERGGLAVEAHPMVERLTAIAPRCVDWLDPLATTRWPVVMQHGDFTPWNVKETHEGIRAYDWEYANEGGFPGFDLAFYWMQTQSLLHGRRPDVALVRAANAVANFLGVDAAAARSIVRLSMLDAYLLGREDGHPNSFPNQLWRYEVVGSVVDPVPALADRPGMGRSAVHAEEGLHNV